MLVKHNAIYCHNDTLHITWCFSNELNTQLSVYEHGLFLRRHSWKKTFFRPRNMFATHDVWQECITFLYITITEKGYHKFSRHRITTECFTCKNIFNKELIGESEEYYMKNKLGQKINGEISRGSVKGN